MQMATGTQAAGQEQGDPRIAQARAFAQQVHEASGQTYNGKSYFVHPQRVAEIVAGLTSDPLAQVVAYLHDTVEDTAVTLAEIAERFGPEVAADVASLTRDKEKEEYMAFVARAAQRPRARLVKLADLRANIEAFADPACDKPLKKLDQYRQAEAYILQTYGLPA
jgi:(p)ppGpp synthase/HD superfamily hydrolase